MPQARRSAPRSPAQSGTPRRAGGSSGELLWLGAILVATCLAYARIWDLGYAWDDAADIQQHRYVRGEGTIAQIFSGDTYAGAGRSSGYYRPMVVTTNRFLQQLGQGSAVPHHAMNLLLHLLVCILLFRLVRDRAGSAAALVATALFAVHPVNSEVVAANAGLKDLLVAAPFLACLILLPQARTRSGSARAVACVALAAVSLVGAFSKESFIVVLPILAVQDAVLAIAQRRAKSGEAWSWSGAITPYACVVVPVALGWAARFAFVSPESMAGVTSNVVMNPMQLLPQPYRLLTAGRIAAYAAGLVFFPATLSADYSYPTIPVACSLGAFDGILGILAGVVLVVTLAMALVRGRVLAIALSMVLVPWAAVGQIVALTTVMFAERFLYLPLLGVAFTIALLGVAAAAAGMQRGLALARPLGIALTAIVVVIFAGRTYARSGDWVDGTTLVQRTVETAPRSFNVRPHLASAATVAGRPQEALDLLAPLLQLDDPCPYTHSIAATDPLVHLVAGDALTSLRRFAEAREQLRIAVTQQPEVLRNWFAYGRSYAVAEELPAAVAVWEEGLSRSKEAMEVAPTIRAGLSRWYFSRGEMDAARRHWDALLADPLADPASLQTVLEQAKASGDQARIERAQQRLAQR